MMIKHVLGAVAFSIAAAVSAVACTASHDDAAVSQPSAPAPKMELGRTYYTQIVTFNKDGTYNIDTRSWNLETDPQERERLAVTSCRGAALELYDAPVGETSDNICFGEGNGTISLLTLSDPGLGAGAVWAYNVGSYQSTGNGDTSANGYFADNSTGTVMCALFTATTMQTNVPDPLGFISYVTEGATSCPNPGCAMGDFECGEICDGYQKWTCFPNSDCPTGCDQNTYCEMHTTCP